MSLQKALSAIPPIPGGSQPVFANGAYTFSRPSGATVSLILPSGVKPVAKEILTAEDATNFTVIRAVINLGLVMADDPSQPAPTNTSFTLKIQLADTDSGFSGGRDKLKFAYYLNGWQEISETSPKAAGEAVFNLSYWPADPMVGVGRR